MSEGKKGSDDSNTKKIAEIGKNLLSKLPKNKFVLIGACVILIAAIIGIKACSSKSKTSNKNGEEISNTAKASVQKEIDEASKSIPAGFYSIVSGQKIDKTVAESAPMPSPLYDFSYKVCDTKPGLSVRYVGIENNIIFPQEIEGVPVVEVGVQYSQGDKNIVIPEGVEIISNMGGTAGGRPGVSIINLDIPTTVKLIRDGAFAGCILKGDVAINSLCKLGNGLFAYAKIHKVVWPFASVPDFSFENCSTLVVATFSDSTKLIGKNAFAGCPDLETIILSDSTTIIGYGAFANCRSLAEAKLPKAVSSMGERAFRNDSSLVNVTGIESCAKFEVPSMENDSRNTDSSGSFATTSAEGETTAGRQFEGCAALSIASENKIREIGYKEPFVWHREARPGAKR